MTRWCLGPCGRELPVEYFPHRHGRPTARCRTCTRFSDRTRKRRRYQSCPSYRRSKRAYNRMLYARDPEPQRAYSRRYRIEHREQLRAYDRSYKRRLRKRRAVEKVAA